MEPTREFPSGEALERFQKPFLNIFIPTDFHFQFVFKLWERRLEKEIGFKEKLNNLKAVHCSYTLNVKLISFNQKIRVKIFSIDPIFVS